VPFSVGENCWVRESIRRIRPESGSFPREGSKEIENVVVPPCPQASAQTEAMTMIDLFK
jgi:hypothetical protein